MYKVGTRLLSYTDESRKESLGPKEGPRYVGVRLYYPAKVENEKLFEIEGKTYGECYECPEFAEGSFPVLVYNHGYSSYLECNNYLCCQLAAEGYFVVAIGHAYECEEISLSDGRKLFLDPETRKLQIYPRFLGTVEAMKVKGVKGDLETQAQAFEAYQKKYCSFLLTRIEEWGKDVNFAMSKVEEEFATHMAKEGGYGIFGHSFGGALAYYMCQNFKEYVKGVDIDGAIFGEFQGMTMTKPFLLVVSPGNVAVTSRARIQTSSTVTCEIVEGASHLSFIDLKYYREKGFMMGKLSHKEISDKLYGYVSEFFGTPL